MTHIGGLQPLDAWLQKADELLAAGDQEHVVDEDTLGARDVGRRRCRLDLERDLELHIGTSSILGDQFVSIGLWQPSDGRYRDRIRLPSHRLAELIEALADLKSFLGVR